MNNRLNLLEGFALLVLGIIITIIQVRKIRARKDDQLGFDYRLLDGGIIFIMCGLVMIFK